MTEIHSGDAVTIRHLHVRRTKRGKKAVVRPHKLGFWQHKALSYEEKMSRKVRALALAEQKQRIKNDKLLAKSESYANKVNAKANRLLGKAEKIEARGKYGLFVGTERSRVKNEREQTRVAAELPYVTADLKHQKKMMQTAERHDIERAEKEKREAEALESHIAAAMDLEKPVVVEGPAIAEPIPAVKNPKALPKVRAGKFIGRQGLSKTDFIRARNMGISLGSEGTVSYAEEVRRTRVASEKRRKKKKQKGLFSLP
jgi:hypothetical protein